MKTAIKWLLWTLAFVPLIVDTSVYFPYITGKSLLIRLSVSLALLLFSFGLFSSKDFREESLARFKKFIKNPIVYLTFVFFAFFVLSAVLAKDTFRAFLGDVERAEGVFGMMYFYVFLVISGIIFEKKDWIRFFKLSLITGFILFAHEMFQFFSGLRRPSSMTGNPIYIAAFFLFVILSALIILNQKEKESAFWRVFSWLMIVFSVVGIFVSESRGVIVGMMAAIGTLAIYFVFRGKEIKIFGKTNLKTISIFSLIFAVLFLGVFFETKNAKIWQKLPGFDRLASISSLDNTTQTRLISLGVGLDSINPQKNSLKEFLFGWGPENFSIAYNKYYNPTYFEFEQAWFDRSHNKLMDVAVMHGIFGLLSYLALWGAFFVLISKRKELVGQSASLLFFGVSYFVQNLFAFDSISTYTPFFVMLAFAAHLTTEEKFKEEKKESIKLKEENLFSAGFFVLSLFLVFATIAFFLVPYFQMRAFLSYWRSSDISQILKAQKTLSPYTYAQENIRLSFLDYVFQYLNPKDALATQLYQKSTQAVEELIQKEPFDPRYHLSLAKAYVYLSQLTGNSDYLKLAQKYAQEALNLAPKRQDVRVQLAYIFAKQEKGDEAIDLLKETVALDPKVGDMHYYLAVMLSSFDKDYKETINEIEKAINSPNFTRFKQDDKLNPTIIAIYEQAFNSAFKNKDKEYFLKIASRLKEFFPEKSPALEKMIDLAQKGAWQEIHIIER
jgi:O-antigen ligase/Tfp pilus assembly protein PilF